MGAGGSGSGPSYKNQYISYESGDDYRLVVEGHSGIAILKEDLDVSIAAGISANENFQESWANNFPDPKANSGIIDFFYRGNLIQREYYVSVDGGRAYLPIPKRNYSGDHGNRNLESLTISELEDKFFRIFDSLFAAGQDGIV